MEAEVDERTTDVTTTTGATHTTIGGEGGNGLDALWRCLSEESEVDTPHSEAAEAEAYAQGAIPRTEPGFVQGSQAWDDARAAGVEIKAWKPAQPRQQSLFDAPVIERYVIDIETIVERNCSPGVCISLKSP